MTELSDNVKSAITAAVHSASIHMDYVGDLQQGYHTRDANQQSRASETTDNQKVNSSVDNAKQEHQRNQAPALASTATGLPDPSAIASAIDHVEEKEQDADEPGVASTAIGLPASEPILNAMKEGDDDVSTKQDTPLSTTLQKTFDTVTSATTEAARNVIDNLAPGAQDGSPSDMKHQQQPEKSGKQMDSDQSGTCGVSAPPQIKEPTHTIIDDTTKSMEPTPVEPVVENIVANIQAVEEPVVMEQEIVPEPRAEGARATPADAKTEKSPDVIVGENACPAEQVAVAEDPIGEEITVDQISSPAGVTTAASDSKPETNLVVADIKTQDMPVGKEPATLEDLRTKPLDVEQSRKHDDGLINEPIKKDGLKNSNDVNVEQQPKDASPTSTNDLHQQPTAPLDRQSRSIESKSLPLPPSPKHQDQASVDASTDQPQQQTNAPKESKCSIM